MTRIKIIVGDYSLEMESPHLFKHYNLTIEFIKAVTAEAIKFSNRETENKQSK